jgi:hypothetical protein
MKLAKGTAGMCWPNVPFAVTLKVRDEAKLSRLTRPRNGSADVDGAVSVSGRISRVPMALPLPVPKNDCRMSSSAMVWPASTEKVVICPSAMVPPLGV